MKAEYIVQEITKNKLDSALNLINKVFDEFVAYEYSQEGVKTFKDFCSFDAISKMMDEGLMKMWGVIDNNQVIGIIATRDVSHISMFFVDKEYQKRGIGKCLFARMLNDNALNDKIEITVNSSPYANDFYHSLGFEDTDIQKEMNGIIYTPMKYTDCAKL